MPVTRQCARAERFAATVQAAEVGDFAAALGIGPPDRRDMRLRGIGGGTVAAIHAPSISETRHHAKIYIRADGLTKLLYFICYVRAGTTCTLVASDPFKVHAHRG